MTCSPRSLRTSAFILPANSNAEGAEARGERGEAELKAGGFRARRSVAFSIECGPGDPHDVSCHTQKVDEKGPLLAPKKYFQKFGPSILGLDDILANKETFEALAVIVDLKDFTVFCDQRDPHLVVPQFVKSFLEWLFDRLRAQLLMEEAGNNVVLWSHLPFFGKFLGDGVLLLWDVTDMDGEAKRSIVQSFDVICDDYETKFLPSLR